MSVALVKEIQLPACKGLGDYWQIEKPKQYYVKLMYRLENVSAQYGHMAS